VFIASEFNKSFALVLKLVENISFICVTKSVKDNTLFHGAESKGFLVSITAFSV